MLVLVLLLVLESGDEGEDEYEEDDDDDDEDDDDEDDEDDDDEDDDDYDRPRRAPADVEFSGWARHAERKATIRHTECAYYFIAICSVGPNSANNCRSRASRRWRRTPL